MNKKEKNQLIDTLTEQISTNKYLYITDIANMNVANTGKLRRLCFRRGVKLVVVKNALLQKAMERSGKNFEDLYSVLTGHTSIMFAEQANTPAKLIKEFRKTGGVPILKGAYVEESVFVGDNHLDALCNLKTKNELIADIIAMLQSPAKNVISALQSGGHTISGVLKTLSEKPE
jgi:large subunit ribosomal protein L10